MQRRAFSLCLALCGGLGLPALLRAEQTSGADPGTADPDGQAASDLTLVMVEQAGCIYCARWDERIAPAYPKTPEGRAAPLRRIDLHAPRPDDLDFAAPLVFTPTFVLMRDGRELGRIEGYPGEDFFWGLLDRLLQTHSDFEKDKT